MVRRLWFIAVQFIFASCECAEAFYRCSYLAKARGKGYGSLGANNYSGSRVQTKKRFEHHINRANLYTFFDLK